MELNERIGRFEQLVKDDPTNDIAHFSLAGAYNQAGRFAEAAASYRRCFELNPSMSKAYQLAGAAYMAANDTELAVRVLTEGFTVAAHHGDLMPKKAMVELLKKLGAAVPEDPVASGAGGTPGIVGGGDLVCRSSGKPGRRMARPPFRGAVGAWIVEQITQESFDEWIGLGTKIINELRLDLSRDEHDAVYDYAMRRFLRLDDATYDRVTGGKTPPAPPRDFKQTVDDILGRMGKLEEFKGELYRGVKS